MTGGACVLALGLLFSPLSALAAENRGDSSFPEAERVEVEGAHDRVYSIAIRMEQAKAVVADSELLVAEGRRATITVADDKILSGSYRIGLIAQRAAVPGKSSAVEGIALDIQIFRGEDGRWVLVSEPGFVVEAGSAATLSINGVDGAKIGVDGGLRLAISALSLQADEAVAECARIRGTVMADGLPAAIAGPNPGSNAWLRTKGENCCTVPCPPPPGKKLTCCGGCCRTPNCNDGIGCCPN